MQGTMTRPASGTGPAGTGRGWTVLAGLTVLLFAWAMSGVPLMAIPEAMHDDALFVRQAANLLGGRWFGPYDNLTLAKGPFYPVWIAFGWLVGLPILVMQGLAYGLACLLLARGLRPWLRSEAVTYAVFLVLLLNPITYSLGQLRVMREGIYVPLTILIFALLVWWVRWRDRPIPLRAALAAGLGLVAGLFWCTREEGIWILPALAVSALLILSAQLAGARARLAALGGELVLAGVGVGVAALVVAGFGWMNQQRYGVSDVVEFKQREFVSAYGSLSRIRHTQPWKPYVVIPRETLERAYAVSPAAAELRPYFDSPAPDGFAQVGCATYAVAPCDREVRAGWFMWALRDAVAQAGHYRSAPEAREFYGRLAAEIAAACDDGRLDCLPPRATMAPPFRQDYVWPTVQTAGRMLGFMATLVSAEVPRNAMSCYADDCGQTGGRAIFLDMVRSPLFVHAPWLSSVTEFQRRSSADQAVLPFQRRSDAIARGLEVVIKGYRTVLPWALGAGVLAYLAAGMLSLYRRRVEALFLVATVAAVLVACRVVLLAYLEVTAIPSMNSLYLSPAYPALLLFVVTAILALISQFGRQTKTMSEERIAPTLGNSPEPAAPKPVAPEPVAVPR